MTAHQLAYVKYLVRRIKDLFIENEAMSAALDIRIAKNGGSSGPPWRDLVRFQQADEVYCSAVEANFAPYFSRIERALLDEAVLRQLQESGSTRRGSR